MDEGYTYPAPPGSEAESAQVPAPAQAPAYSAPAPFPPAYSVAGYDGGDEQGGEQAPEASIDRNAMGNFAYMDDDMQAFGIVWPNSFDNELASALAAAPAPMAGSGPGQSVSYGQPATHGQLTPMGQPNAFVPGYNLPHPAPALPGPQAPIAQHAPVGQHGPLGIAANAAPGAPGAPGASAGPVAPQPLLPPGFRLQENHVLRHDWPQGALQPSPKHGVYERSKNPKPAQDNAMWCNSCEHWLWEPCYQRVPIGDRDNARCCNRCHWRKKRFRGMGLHQWLLLAQPRMMHLLKKDQGYVA
ncbi:hypothetical protein LZ30DRAFT_749787 [Colletotrichum cereale]|nr:hypothetical protein LZ30DRAFT_749787 [Colletotrichum cereale]